MSNTTQNVEIPEEYICPISYEIMTDPVVASDGQTYQRGALLQWLQVRQISPLTNQPLTATGIVTNYALRAAIERWIADHAAVSSTGADARPVKKRAPPQFTLRSSKNNRIKYLSCDTKEPMETIEILVLDVSGSMQDRATRTPDKEGGNYTRLDLVKHASRTVAAMLAERTSQGTPAYLSLITYSNDAKIVLPLRKMSADNLDITFAVLENIRTEGATNIWDGLRLALDTAARAAHMHPDASISIRLLTDGEPTSSLIPITGIVGALERKMATMKHVDLSVSAFGFGFALDDQLLRQISDRGDGIFGYIPDCSMVATVFINAVANSLATVARNIRVEWANGAVTQLGGFARGQEKYILTEETSCTVYSGEEKCVELRVTEQKGVDTEFEESSYDIVRWLTTFLDGTTTVDGLRGALRAIKDSLLANKSGGDLADDIEHTDAHKGQLMKALSRADWLNEWGRNHCIAYMRALQKQQCVNFKDAAPQRFLTDEVSRLREMGNLLFNNLPAPKPTGYGGYDALGGGPVNMAIFNNANGGCWTGDCEVRMGDDSYFYANEVKAGHYMWGGHRVICVVRTEYEEPIRLCKIGDLTITPWHPVQNKNDKERRWYFPADLVAKGVVGGSVQEMVHYTYNYVLESGHTVEISGYKACTLGHYMEGDVIGHEYFGTRRVIEDLKYQPGWTDGLVTIKPTQWIRGEDGRVCGLRNGPLLG
jgi:Mg-chelatase subunit ChlD